MLLNCYIVLALAAKTKLKQVPITINIFTTINLCVTYGSWQLEKIFYLTKHHGKS